MDIETLFSIAFPWRYNKALPPRAKDANRAKASILAAATVAIIERRFFLAAAWFGCAAPAPYHDGMSSARRRSKATEAAAIPRAAA